MKTRYALDPVNRECGSLDQAEKKNTIKSESKFRLIVYGMLSLKKKKKKKRERERKKKKEKKKKGSNNTIIMLHTHHPIFSRSMLLKTSLKINR